MVYRDYKRQVSRYLFSLAILFGLFGICQAQSVPEGRCGFPVDYLAGISHRCGQLQVPENHLLPTEKNLTITYLILKSPSKEALAPMLYFSGGPGSASLTEGRILNWAKNPILQHRDIILFDQRGTGQSSALPGMEHKLFDLLAADLTIKEELTAMQELQRMVKKDCRQQGIDLRQYNSFQSARDVHVLMNHLDYPEYNLYGVSYGTRLARIVQDLVPHKVRTVVLNSPNPLKGDFLVDRLHSYTLALQRIIEYCMGDSECQQTYPDLTKLYYKTIESLKDQPLKITINGEPFHINAQDAIYLIRRMLYRNDAKMRVPQTISALGTGDQGQLRDIVQSELLFSKNYNASMWLSVERHEMFDLNNTEVKLRKVYDQLPLLPVSLGIFHSFYLAGMDWHDATLSADAKRFQTSNVPTLITVNYYDPVTPPINGHVMMESLSKGQLFILDEVGHGGGNAPCRYEIMHSFMTNPGDVMDTSCLNIHRP